MENREITALLADFESIWQRVNLPAAGETEEQIMKTEAVSPRPELYSVLLPRWFGVI